MGDEGAGRLAGVLGQCSSLAVLNLSSEEEDPASEEEDSSDDEKCRTWLQWTNLQSSCPLSPGNYSI